MFPIRVKVCQESDLRMLGDLARNIQRVLPVTQADIDAAAALGKGWVVWKVFEVSDPLDNLRGGTQLIIKQNSVQPGQNVHRVIFVSGPGGETVVIGPAPSPLLLPDAVANSLSYVKAFGGTEQRNLPDGYTQLEYIESTGTQYIDTGVVTQNGIGFDVTFLTNNSVVPGNMSYGAILGGRASSGNNDFQITTFTPAGSTMGTIRNGPSTPVISAKISTNTKLHISLISDVITYNDGTTASVSSYEYTAGKNIYLFGINSGDSFTQSGDGCRIYNAKLLVGSNVVFDGIPAKQGTTIGMYDLVSGQFFTNAGTDDFTAGPDAVPTPDAPMDIVSNNGVLRARHQSGLPLGYTLLDYIESTGTQYINTGITSYKNTNKLKLKIRPSQVASTTFITFQNPNSGNNNIGLFISSKTLYYQYFSGARLNSSLVAGTDYVIETGNGFLTVNGDSYTGAIAGAFTVSAPLYVGAGTNTDGVVDSRRFVGRIYYYRYEDADGNLLFNGIPAKDSNDVIGMYDTVSGQFFTNAGTGDFTEGNPVNDLEIYTDGTVETINAHGKNLIDESTLVKVSATIWRYYSTTSQGGFNLKANTTYTLSTDNPNINVYFYDYETKTSIASGKSFKTYTPTEDVTVYFTLYLSAGIPDDTRIQLEIGDTATDYEPYYDGGTATAEMLLKVGNYQDVQEILSGNITRNVGVKPITGDMVVNYFPSSNRCIISTGDIITTHTPIMCTHFPIAALGDYYINHSSDNQYIYCYSKDCSSLQDYRDFFNNQYAAGTPVIVIYPLATPTTESVAGQTLQVDDGDNTLEITQASLLDLELEAEYEQGVEALVEEIEP